MKLGVPICEDIWLEPVCAHSPRRARRFCWYPTAAPTRLDKDDQRQRLVRDRVVETGLPLVYLNRVGGQDELVFDGSSFVVNDDGEIAVQMTDWEEALAITEWVRTANGWRCETGREGQPLRLPRGHLSRDDGRAARLCRGQRLSRRDPRPVGRDRQCAFGCGRGRCAGRRQGALRDDAVQIYRRRKPGGRGRMRAVARLRHDVIPIVPGVEALGRDASPATDRGSPPRISSRGSAW